MPKKLIDIIVPIFNEEKNIPVLYERVQKAIQPLRMKYDFRYLFVNDGSRDQSMRVIKDLAQKDNSVHYLEFSRNFGKEAATSAGLHNAEGDASIMMDADLQHPPELIPQFIQKWEQGAEIVVGVRNGSRNQGLTRRFFSSLFYKIMNAIGETRITPHATDFRILDRKVVQEFDRFGERNRITRGLIDWMGFAREEILFEAPERLHGKAGYSNLKLMKLALSSFIAHSLLPLKITGYAGLLITLVSGLAGAFMVWENYIAGDPWGWHLSGTAILAVLVIFLVGIVLSGLGLIALYVAQIQVEAQKRPMYVVREKS